jgi:outer membrane receptor for ferrienterochelin and colicins
MKEISRLESPVPIEVITPALFRKNPVPSLFEAVGMINGVKPQINCNVCNTGDIHINGMEGPYTMVLIDGMPIVSNLATVYGLSGIPNSIVERIEVMKGPGSSLYGSEAMGGIINIITKNPSRAPAFSADLMATSWQEYNADVALKTTGSKLYNLLGINYFHYNTPIDNNNDDFTDVTLQKRLSLFNKISLKRKEYRLASLAIRYVYEDRWGGQMNWSKSWRGTDSIYGESIYTNRLELIGMYQLPVKPKIIGQFSYNWHDHDSYYGTTPYMATQQVGFGQLYWQKEIKTHEFLTGTSFRYTIYDDNTPGTLSPDGKTNSPDIILLPGFFLQDEWKINDKHKLLIGYRYDYDKRHGNINSPRIAYKWSPNENNTLRGSFGTGFRVVNLFTEDHAALTGARQIIIAEELKPERSYNGNINYNLRHATDHSFWNLDMTLFYSYFTNKINGDFDTDPNKIIYKNLVGHAVSKGVSVNLDLNFLFPLKILTGLTYQDVYEIRKDIAETKYRTDQLFAPKWSGNLVATYSFKKRLSLDFTTNWYGPMKLPVVANDFRPEYSPFYCIANIQLTKKFNNGLEIYGGIKNLLNFVPVSPILRPNDPFDKNVNDPVSNPQGYTFDASYNYASLQGIKGFLGIRYQLDQ